MKKPGVARIELFMVMLILMALAIIIFPILVRPTSRYTPRQPICPSNEKQIALGLLQYAQDNDNTLPAPYDVPTHTFWPARVYPYIKSTQVFLCPEDAGTKLNVNVRGDNDRVSYGLNAALGGATPTAFFGHSLTKVRHPDQTCLIAEDYGLTTPDQGYGAYFHGSMANNTGPFDAGYAMTYYSGLDQTPVRLGAGAKHDHGFGYRIGFVTPVARHTGGANIAFTDGHVKWMHFADIYNPPLGTTPAHFSLWHPEAP